MGAFGLNAGQRHRRLFGAVANVIKECLKRGMAREEIDRKFMGGLSIIYAFYESRLPQEILMENSAALDALGLPPIFTETIPPGVLSLPVLCLYVQPVLTVKIKGQATHSQ